MYGKQKFVLFTVTVSLYGSEWGLKGKEIGEEGMSEILIPRAVAG